MTNGFEKPDYSPFIGLWKTVKNGLIFLGPSIVAFVLALPEDVQLKYAPALGTLIYFLRNYMKNK